MAVQQRLEKNTEAPQGTGGPMSLRRSTPHAEGLDAQGIADLVAAAEVEGLDLHSLMVARHGSVVAEGWWAPYRAASPTLVYSMSKTLTALAIGLAEHDGLVRLEDPILSLLGIDPRSVAPIWSDVRIEHCLSMTAGFDSESSGLVYDRMQSEAVTEEDWLDAVLSSPPILGPGETFTYCQAPSYLLSRVHRQVTGRGLVASLTNRLPGVFPSGSLQWATDPQGHELGYSGAHLTTEAILSLAQLHLDRGRWAGHAVLGPNWVENATSAPSTCPSRREGPDWSLGYGYSLWNQRHGYRADGAYGQMALVIPEASMVVAVTAETVRPQTLLDLVWAHLLPAVDREGSAAADDDLAGFLGDRSLPLVSGVTASVRTSATFDRSPQSTLALEWRRASVRPALTEGHSVVEFAYLGETVRLPVANSVWLPSQLRSGNQVVPVAANGGWINERTYAAEVVLTQTPHRFRLLADRRTGLVDLSWRLPTLAGLDPLHVSQPAPAA